MAMRQRTIYTLLDVVEILLDFRIVLRQMQSLTDGEDRPLYARGGRVDGV